MIRLLSCGIRNLSSLSKISPGIFFSRSKEEWKEYFEKRNAISANWIDNVEYSDFELGEVTLRLKIEEHHIAPNGFVFGGLIAHFADVSCGHGAVCHLPTEKSSLATTELSCHLIDTANLGDFVSCKATLRNQTRRVQVWDAELVNESTDKIIALFRCTEVILPDRSRAREELLELEDDL